MLIIPLYVCTDASFTKTSRMKLSTKPSSPFRSSEFFNNFDWEALETFMIEPPFVPPPVKDEPPVDIPPMRPTTAVSAAVSDQPPAKVSHYLESTMASRVQQATITAHRPPSASQKKDAADSGSTSVSALCATDPYSGPTEIFDDF
jgi:hypothetical protein